ncbi:hypothetical protein [Xanthobacter autotrophicus]|uniref:hypothetical protein n=1 Tax=Xanthobacter autotrophicus TaxID=280 RepID=UPI003728AAA1
MLGWHNESTADRVSRRIAALKDELDDLQSSLWPKSSLLSKPGSLERMASDAQDWISERAADLPKVHLPHMNLPHLNLPDVRRHLPAPPPSMAVIAAAVAVGAGVGCVLYALTSRGRRRPASFAPKGHRRAAS